MSFKAITDEGITKNHRIITSIYPWVNETRQLRLAHKVFERKFLQTKFDYVAKTVQSIMDFMLIKVHFKCNCQIKEQEHERMAVLFGWSDFTQCHPG